MEVLHQTGVQAARPLQEFQRDAAIIRPGHRALGYEFAVQYLLKYAEDPQSELVRRGYLADILEAAFPGSPSEQQARLADMLRFTHGKELSKDTIGYLCEQQGALATQAFRAAVASLEASRMPNNPPIPTSRRSSSVGTAPTRRRPSKGAFRPEPSEAQQAEAERRRTVSAEAKERWLAQRRLKEKRLLPLSQAVRASALMLSLTAGTLCACSVFNWEPRVWLFLLIPGLMLSLAPATFANRINFIDSRRGGFALAALCTADAGSVLFASRVLITFPTLIVVIAWGIATYYLSSEQAEYEKDLKHAIEAQL
jgi:hypothetical protein